MGVITIPVTLADNTVPSAAQFMANWQTIYSEFNGNISNANISPTAAIVYSKLNLAAAIKESDLLLADNTTADVSTSAHGFVPKAPNDTTKFLRGDGSWSTVTSGYGKVRKNTTQSMSGSLQTVTWDVEELDSASFIDLNTHNDRITIPTTGIYRISVQIAFNNTSANTTQALQVQKNADPSGGVVIQCTANTNSGITAQPILTGSTILSLTAGDYLIVQASHSTSIGLIGDNPGKTYFEIERIG